jgi:hypothetical protein
MQLPWFPEFGGINQFTKNRPKHNIGIEKIKKTITTPPDEGVATAIDRVFAIG